MEKERLGNPAVFGGICQILREAAIPFRTVHHEPTRTSEESARARGEDLSTGGKALVVKVGESFKLFVLSATLKLDSESLKRHFAVKKTRFASAEELESITGLVPGSVPPFGEPILPFELYVDDSITRNERIAFNAGMLTDSIVMTVEDYLRVTQPKTLKFSL